ncbi:MAG: cytochrome b/b6 domain-containing protein [Coriobacteriia bacterium]|jgi:Ni/Fe-hydrogenase 1 B-type cytochrome subunit|nr:cytochrome b/b6 domain-containing protein [Coriobacteriia bacterium]MDR2713973.1 cytochrome b/b6 domain-containing protein [Coriobacteriales bacterium]
MAHLAHYKEAHPVPFIITHWVNLVSMLCLILTGFYIHFPFVAGFMGMARGAHMFFAFVILINLIVRIILAFIVKSAPAGGTREVVTDYKNFLPQKDNRHQLGAWVKYYLFLKKDHPLGNKFGVPQKITYFAVPFLLLLMGFVGFCLWPVTMFHGPFAAFTNLVGGLMIVRIIHYYLMWVFILFMFIHVYLSSIEGFAPAKLMFTQKEHGGLVYDPEVHNIVGEDIDVDED